MIMFFSCFKNKKNKETSTEPNEVAVKKDPASTPYQSDVTVSPGTYQVNSGKYTARTYAIFFR